MSDFVTYAGEDWPQLFRYVDSSANGIIIADADILFVAVSTSRTSPVTIEKSTSNGTIRIEDQVGYPGEFTVLIAGADTTGIGSNTFNYEIKLTLNEVARVIYPAPNGVATFDVITSLTDGVNL